MSDFVFPIRDPSDAPTLVTRRQDRAWPGVAALRDRSGAHWRDTLAGYNLPSIFDGHKIVAPFRGSVYFARKSGYNFLVVQDQDPAQTSKADPSRATPWATHLYIWFPALERLEVRRAVKGAAFDAYDDEILFAEFSDIDPGLSERASALGDAARSGNPVEFYRRVMSAAPYGELATQIEQDQEADFGSMVPVRPGQTLYTFGAFPDFDDPSPAPRPTDGRPAFDLADIRGQRTVLLGFCNRQRVRARQSHAYYWFDTHQHLAYLAENAVDTPFTNADDLVRPGPTEIFHEYHKAEEAAPDLPPIAVLEGGLKNVRLINPPIEAADSRRMRRRMPPEIFALSETGSARMILRTEGEVAVEVHNDARIAAAMTRNDVARSGANVVFEHGALAWDEEPLNGRATPVTLRLQIGDVAGPAFIALLGANAVNALAARVKALRAYEYSWLSRGENARKLILYEKIRELEAGGLSVDGDLNRDYRRFKREVESHRELLDTAVGEAIAALDARYFEELRTTPTNQSVTPKVEAWNAVMAAVFGNPKGEARLGGQLEGTAAYETAKFLWGAFKSSRATLIETIFHIQKNEATKWYKELGEAFASDRNPASHRRRLFEYRQRHKTRWGDLEDVNIRDAGAMSPNEVGTPDIEYVVQAPRSAAARSVIERLNKGFNFLTAFYNANVVLAEIAIKDRDEISFRDILAITEAAQTLTESIDDIVGLFRRSPTEVALADGRIARGVDVSRAMIWTKGVFAAVSLGDQLASFRKAMRGGNYASADYVAIGLGVAFADAALAAAAFTGLAATGVGLALALAALTFALLSRSTRLPPISADLRHTVFGRDHERLLELWGDENLDASRVMRGDAFSESVYWDWKDRIGRQISFLEGRLAGWTIAHIEIASSRTRAPSAEAALARSVGLPVPTAPHDLVKTVVHGVICEEGDWCLAEFYSSAETIETVFYVDFQVREGVHPAGADQEVYRSARAFFSADRRPNGSFDVEIYLYAPGGSTLTGVRASPVGVTRTPVIDPKTGVPQPKAAYDVSGLSRENRILRLRDYAAAQRQLLDVRAWEAPR